MGVTASNQQSLFCGLTGYQFVLIPVSIRPHAAPRGLSYVASGEVGASPSSLRGQSHHAMLELLLEGGSPLPPLRTGGNRIENNLSPQFWGNSQPFLFVPQYGIICGYFFLERIRLMRLVAEHPQQELIRKFLQYLRKRGVAAEMRSGNSAWGLWVHHEDSCRDARREFDAFLRDPTASKYEVAHQAAPETDAPDAGRVRQRQRAQRLATLAARRHGFLSGPTPVTMTLIVISVMVTLPLLLGGRGGDFSDLGKRVIGLLYADSRISTQWWRLLTPAFLHFNGLHILFNMLWLRELGGRVERIKGSGFLILFFVVSAAVSNYAQLIGGGGTLFGGMSGVVYGLFGFVWVKSRFFPEEGFMIDPTTVMLLMFFFFLGWTGLMPIANWAHGFGLLSGVALALAPSRRSG